MGKVLPILLILVGFGGGVGAGIFLRPPPEEMDMADCGDDEPCDEMMPMEEESHIVDGELVDGDGTAFAVLKKQFVIPVLPDDRVTGLVVVSVAIAVDDGTIEAVFEVEPKLRDAFLRVLFIHASSGGFDGNFLNDRVITDLKERLNEVAKPIVGDIFQEVLLTEIVRQDF